MSPNEKYAQLNAAYNRAVEDLSQFAETLPGFTVLFKRGKKQVVLAEVIGAKGTRLTIRNVESDRSYFVDLRNTEIVKIT